MKKLTITALAGALLVLAGCIQAELDPLPEEDGIRITLNCGEIGTRTDYPEELEGEANENLINSVDYFLFSSNNQRSIYSGHLEPKVAGDFTFYIKTTVAGVNTGTTYTVFTIVNLPESKRIGSVVNDRFVWNSLSRSDLDQILLDEATDPTFTSVTTNGSDSRYEPAGKDLSLVMTGESEPFTVSDLQEATTVPVNLERLPAKVTMEFFIKDRIVRNEKGVTETWTPMTSGANVRAYLCNGAKSIQVGGSAAQDPDRIFSYQPSVDNVAISSDKEGYSKAFRSEAFYSYPRQWSQGDKDEPFLKLIIPWKVRRVVDGVTTESQKEFYYKVMLPSELAGTGNDKGFVKNHWYRLIVDVDRLGSATDDAAVTVPCEYAVLDWGDLQGFNLNMVQALYLDVNEGKYEVEFYGDKLELPFFSSGSVSYTVDNAYYNVFRTEASYTYESSNRTPSPITTSTPINEWQSISTSGGTAVTVYTYSRNGQPTVRTTTPFNQWELIETGYRYTLNGQPDIYTTTSRSQWNLEKTGYRYTVANYASRWSPQTFDAAAQLNLGAPVNIVYEYTSTTSGALSPVVTTTLRNNWSRTSTNPYTYRMNDENGNSVTVVTNAAYNYYTLQKTTYYYDVNDIDGNPVAITYTYNSNNSPRTPSQDYGANPTTTYHYDAKDYSGNPITTTSPKEAYNESTAYFYKATDEYGAPCIIMTGTDSYGNPTSSTNSTVYLYNANGEIIGIRGGTIGSSNNYNYTLTNTVIHHSADTPHDFSGYDVSVSNEEKFLSIDHELKVDYTNRSYDVSPYIYEITLTLDGHEGEFDKKIKVIQYPSLYLEKVVSGNFSSENPATGATSGQVAVFIKGLSFTSSNTGSSNNIFANVNSFSGNNTDANFMGTIIGKNEINNTGGNSNPFIFEVNATILQSFALEINGASVDAVIGDPRVPLRDASNTTYELPDGTSFTFGIIDTQNNSLSGEYRPTANDTQNVISPKFRIASSFGRTRAMSYEGAMRRCAAYQENGYPAGRWRLPTMAEIQFVMQLYGDHKIDMLFDPDNTSGYWAGAGMARFGKGFILGDEVFLKMVNNADYVSNPSYGAGSVTYNVKESPSSSSATAVAVYTRCVYDTWYWGDGQYGNYSSASPSWLGFQTAAPQN